MRSDHRAGKTRRTNRTRGSDIARTLTRPAKWTKRPGNGPCRRVERTLRAPAGDSELQLLVQRSELQSRSLENLPALSAFLRQMETWPQLSADDQLQLAAAVRAGNEARAQLARKRGGDRRLERKVADGQRAAEALAGSTFRLLLLICREKAEERLGREKTLDLLPDLVAEANVALVEAIATYDPELSPTFSLYAGRKIRDRVSATLNNLGPVKVAASWQRLKRIAVVRIAQLEEQLGRPPGLDEIKADLLATALDWAEGKLTVEQQNLTEPARTDAKMARLRKQGMLAAIESIEEVLTVTQTVAHLDAPVGDDDSASLGDLITPVDADSAFAEVEHNEMRDAVVAAIRGSGLTDREQRIVECRYGFVDGELWPYPKIAAEFNVTAERIRQIERTVMVKLRSSEHAGRLAAHLYDTA